MKPMAHLFIRVELRGNPTWQDYDNLHGYMEKNHWYRKIQGTAGESALPHAMYHGNSDNEISKITSALRKGIETNVWSQTIVLVVSAETWAMEPA
jgi:hypothetical protein